MWTCLHILVFSMVSSSPQTWTSSSLVLMVLLTIEMAVSFLHWPDISIRCQSLHLLADLGPSDLLQMFWSLHCSEILGTLHPDPGSCFDSYAAPACLSSWPGGSSGGALQTSLLPKANLQLPVLCRGLRCCLGLGHAFGLQLCCVLPVKET